MENDVYTLINVCAVREEFKTYFTYGWLHQRVRSNSCLMIQQNLNAMQTTMNEWEIYM